MEIKKFEVCEKERIADQASMNGFWRLFGGTQFAQKRLDSSPSCLIEIYDMLVLSFKYSQFCGL